MWLTTEEAGDVPEVTAEDIERILPDDAFGKFVILSASETSFIKAGCDWRPGQWCQTFFGSTSRIHGCWNIGMANPGGNIGPSAM